MIFARGDLGPVAEDDASHDLWQLVFALQAPPGFRGRHYRSMRSSDPLAPRSRTRARATGTGLMPVWIARSGPWPCCTRRTTVRKPQILHRAQEGVRLHLDSLSEQAVGAGAQHLDQGIVDVLGLTKPDDVGRCLHRRIALNERFWQARHPPRYAAFKPPSSPILPHSSAVPARAHSAVQQQQGRARCAHDEVAPEDFRRLPHPDGRGRLRRRAHPNRRPQKARLGPSSQSWPSNPLTSSHAWQKTSPAIMGSYPVRSNREAQGQIGSLRMSPLHQEKNPAFRPG